MATTPEGKVKQAVKKWLDRHAAYWYMVVPTGYSRAGVPDFIACLPNPGGPGIFVGIETKAPGKRRNTTPLQKRELAAIERAGGLALVVDDPAQLDNVLGGYLCETSPGQPAADPQPT